MRLLSRDRTDHRSTFSELGSSLGRPTGLPVWRGAPDRGQPAGGMAMAAALRRAGRRRAVARQDRKPARTLSRATVGQILATALRRAAPTGHPLDGPHVAQVAGVSLRAVQRVWEATIFNPPSAHLQDIQRSGLRRKVEDVVGLYMNPPVHAVVISIDEKSQIQALDRTQPGLP